MAKTITLKSLEEELNPKSRVKLELNGASNLVLDHIALRIEVEHANTATLNIRPESFFANIVKSVILQLGTGNEIIDLDIRQSILRQITKREVIDYSVQTGSGDKKSYINLIIDLASIGYISPKDTVVYTNNFKDKHIMLHANTFTDVSNCTINHVSVKMKEYFLKDMNPLLDAKGGIINATKIPLTTTKSVNGSNSKFEINFPDKALVSEAFIYVEDDKGLVIDGVIGAIEIKNAQSHSFQDEFSELNSQNQMDLFKKKNSFYDGIAHIDIAQGKYSRNINTRLAEYSNTKLVMEADPKGASNLNVVVMFETTK